MTNAAAAAADELKFNIMKRSMSRILVKTILKSEQTTKTEMNRLRLTVFPDINQSLQVLQPEPHPIW